METVVFILLAALVLGIYAFTDLSIVLAPAGTCRAVLGKYLPVGVSALLFLGLALSRPFASPVPYLDALTVCQALYEDYTKDEAKIVLLEMVDELVTELIMRKQTCQTISLGVGYSQTVGGGFNRQLSFDKHTNSRKTIWEAFIGLYEKYTKNVPIRRLNLRLGKLANEVYLQADIFDGMDKTQKEHDLYQALGEIKKRFGKNAVFLALSKTPKGTQIKRNQLIGGHNAE